MEIALMDQISGIANALLDTRETAANQILMNVNRILVFMEIVPIKWTDMSVLANQDTQEPTAKQISMNVTLVLVNTEPVKTKSTDLFANAKTVGPEVCAKQT